MKNTLSAANPPPICRRKRPIRKAGHLPGGVPLRCALAGVLAALALLGPLPTLHAGGGPENVFVVVNPRSWASLTIGNHYVQMRKIPACNVFYLDWKGTLQYVEIDTFRDKFLQPVFSAIKSRHLAEQIDCIAYSSDFPYGVDIRGDLPEAERKYGFGSITALTYLAQLVLQKDNAYKSLDANYYAARAAREVVAADSRAFRSGAAWGPVGDPVQAGGRHYLLATALAVTSGRGNTVGEALDYLKRGVQADGTKPQGTIYFAKNNDVRSRVRHGAFPAAVEELRRLGVAAEIVDGELPMGKKDVQGAMLGVASFSWDNSGSTILPGAICEHLTSHGGNLRENAKQTPISHLLRHGAAGSSGTVYEPYAIGAKFPTPSVHVHYARGCTLAESFYQSVAGPYQLIIIGDPLCRPWANIPRVTIEGLQAGQTVKGTVAITPAAKFAGPSAVARFELFVDGRRRATCPAGQSLSLDTTELPDGFHELRIVAVQAGPIQSQGHAVLTIMVDNHGLSIRLVGGSQGSAVWGQPLHLTARCAGRKSIQLYHNRRVIGEIRGSGGRVSVDTRLLGMGPVSLVAVGLGGEGRTSHVISQPLLLNIVPPKPLPAINAPNESTLSGGVRVRNAAGKTSSAARTDARNWLSKAGVHKNENYVVDALFKSGADKYQQFQLRHRGSLRMAVDGQIVYQSANGDFSLQYVPVSLAPGWHYLQVQGRAADQTELQLKFNHRHGTIAIGDKTRFMHQK